MTSTGPPTLAVRVPGSTSNLGPGFDLLGLALSLFLDVRLIPLAPETAAHELVRTGPAAPELDDRGSSPSGRELLLRAFDRAAGDLGVAGHYRFEMECGIPVGRGFGSSGAAVAAGLLLARALSAHPDTIDRDRLLALGIELEGHPDNVTASLFGGCTLCHPSADARGPVRLSTPLSPGVGIAVAWPATPLSTARARAALPKSIPFADAIENPRRLALLLQGLRSADARLLALGGEDRLHVARRLPLIPGGAEALAAARASGAWLATISGAGSGLVALGSHGQVERIAAAMERALHDATGAGEARVVEPVLEAPRVLRPG